jgi:hypothetical protein
MPNSPLTTISTLLPSFGVDYAAIFTQDYTQIFREARMIKAVVKEQSKVMEHPIENGGIITDHRIVLPVEIDISLILASTDYQDVYKQIRQYYLMATLLVVQTRAGIFKNQLITSMPHEEDPAMFNALTIALSTKQIVFVTPQYGVVPRFPSNSTAINRGTQQGAPATPQNFSAAQSLFEGKPWA